MLAEIKERYNPFILESDRINYNYANEPESIRDLTGIIDSGYEGQLTIPKKLRTIYINSGKIQVFLIQITCQPDTKSHSPL